MIPKVIHYCWFGHNPLPEDAKRYIESWRKYCSGYEIKQWDESNFDIDCIKYVKDAYEAKKWAFVSDYARFWILYKYGGVYFDTDVEIIRPIDDILEEGAFMGMEKIGTIAPGLGMAANPGMSIYKEILEEYDKSEFYKFPGVQEDENVVGKVTRIFKKHGFDSKQNDLQYIEGVTIYTPEYFAPMDYKTSKISLTEKTRTIHHYAATWINPIEKKINELKMEYSKCDKVIAKQVIGHRIRLLKSYNRINELGIINFIKYMAWIVKGKNR